MIGMIGLSLTRKAERFFTKIFKGGLFYLNHVERDFMGVAVADERAERTEVCIVGKSPYGWFMLRWPEGKIRNGIGGCSDEETPVLVNSSCQWGPLAICFEGVILNRSELLKQYKKKVLLKESDHYLVACLLQESKNAVEGIERLVQEVEGSYALLILTPEAIYAVRSPDGHWPLVVGEAEQGVMIASESSGFERLGFTHTFDLKPGQVVRLADGQIESLEQFPVSNWQICSLLWVFGTWPSAVFAGLPVLTVRKQLGHFLADEDLNEQLLPHIIVSFPGGQSCALGYRHHFQLAQVKGILPTSPVNEEFWQEYPYITDPTTLEESATFLPQFEKPSRYEGSTLIVVENAIYRSTTAYLTLLHDLRRRNFGAIHLRIASPQSIRSCRWRKETDRDKERVILNRIFASRESSQLQGLASVRFNRVEVLKKIIGEAICTDCLGDCLG